MWRRHWWAGLIMPSYVISGAAAASVCGQKCFLLSAQWHLWMTMLTTPTAPLTDYNVSHCRLFDNFLDYILWILWHITTTTCIMGWNSFLNRSAQHRATSRARIKTLGTCKDVRIFRDCNLLNSIHCCVDALTQSLGECLPRAPSMFALVIALYRFYSHHLASPDSHQQIARPASSCKSIHITFNSFYHVIYKYFGLMRLNKLP